MVLRVELVKTIRRSLAIGILTLLILGSCKKKVEEVDESFEVSIRLPASPEQLNPFLSRSGYSEYIWSDLFYSLSEISPFDFQLKPVLAKDSARVSYSEEGLYEYTYEIREEAQWGDGQPLTGKDVEFTFEAISCPSVSAASFRSFLSFLDSVKVSPSNERQVSFYVNEHYFLSPFAIGIIPILPKHVFDPEGFIDSVQCFEFSESTVRDRFLDSLNQYFIKVDLFDSECTSGPYHLEKSKGKRFTLMKKNNWWGKKLRFNDGAWMANPDKILYEVVEDNQAAIQLLKSGVLDIAIEIPHFLENEIARIEKAKFYHVSQLGYQFMAMNKNHPLLAEVKGRKGIAHMIDKNFIIEKYLSNGCLPGIGPVHPSRSYFNPKLEPLVYDLSKAKALVKSAIANSKERRQEQIESKLLKLRLLYPRAKTEISHIALYIKSQLDLLDIKVELIPTDFSTLLSSYRTGDYDLLILSYRQLAVPDDMYQYWHTDNIGSGGNRVAFGNHITDQWIDTIRRTRDEDLRRDLYLKLQRAIYEDQPGVFLYYLSQGLAVSKDLKVQVHHLRPGFEPRHLVPR